MRLSPLPCHAFAAEPPAVPGMVVDFWRIAGPALWFAKDAAFDARFRDRFMAAHDAAARGDLASWAATAEGALALILLLDQFPRNAFRGTRRMYATDAVARATARSAIGLGLDLDVPSELRVFMYLPLGHSESLADQELCVALCGHLPPPHPRHAEGHRDIVRRFGRFPHRNAILGRETTAEEARFLAAGGYAG